MNGVTWHAVALHCTEWHAMVLNGVTYHGGHDVACYGTRLHCTGCMAFLCMSWCGIAWHGLAVLIVQCTYTLLLRFTFWGASSKSDNLVSSPEENH